MSNTLTRGILRLSKRSRTSTSDKSDITSIRSDISSVSQINGGEWSKYDDRVIDCINRSDMVKLKDTLKKKGVSPVKVSRLGKTAIHVAVQKQCFEAVDLMLHEHQPDLSCIDMQDCRTVFHIAALNGDTIMLKKLVDYNSSHLNLKDIQGKTVLHLTASRGELESVKILLHCRVSLNVVDNEGVTPLHVAVTQGHDKVAMLLANCGADVNVEDKEGNTAIMVACTKGMGEVVALLLRKGGEVGVKHRESVDLEKLATDAGNEHVVEVIETWRKEGCPIERESSVDGESEVQVNGHNGNNGTEVNGNGCHNDVVESDHNGHSNGHTNGESNGHTNGHTNGHNDSHPSSTPSNGHNTDDDLHLHRQNGMRSPRNNSDNVEPRKSSNPLPRISLTHPNGHTVNTTPARRSIYCGEENSLTTSIIESLLSLDNISDVESESSLTEDNVHLYERFEVERKELKTALAQKDLRIEELSAEMDSLRTKVSREMEFRTAAEKEVQRLKLQGNVVLEVQNESVEGEVTNNNDNNDANNNNNIEEEQKMVAECDEEGKSVRIDEQLNIDNAYDPYDTESDNGDKHHNSNTHLAVNDGHVAGSDTDDSVNVFTGYRRKSLGTAKQHIDMLEERILSLEEELTDKMERIMQLEENCSNAEEYMELSKRTSVPLEVHNELKSTSRQERNAYKQHISTLQETILLMGGNDADYAVPLDMMDDAEHYCDVTEHSHLAYDVTVLKGKLRDLEEEAQSAQVAMEETVRCYRDHMLAMHERNLDPDLEEILGNIVKLRMS